MSLKKRLFNYIQKKFLEDYIQKKLLIDYIPKNLLDDYIQKKLIESQTVVLRYKKLHPKAKEPTKAYSHDAGLDLYAIESAYIHSGEWKIIKTGLAVDIPKGWHVQIHTRSSYGKHHVRCHLGIIDSGYRNEILIIVFNDGREDWIIEEGTKFCQAVLLPVSNVILEKVEKLSDSDRGQGGFGSSGK